LIAQYRGYNGVTATHDYNWHDAIHSAGSDCGADSPAPCDDNSHGTHTMGTIVGDDGLGNQIGVAPGARWIGCRNMKEGVGTPATYAECFEFFLAPYPVDGDPAERDPSRAPHVINNSWVCPPSEGCDWDTLREVVENVRAAGIMVVASAGNSGPTCSTVQDPPSIYNAAFSVGATNSSDVIASFSSRGPVTVGGLGWRKPDLSAPGVNIRSCVPGGGYQGGWQGTSMAGPHVAGAVALLWSAAPALIGDVDATEALLARTARPRTTTQSCGGDGPDDVPNNVYGWGVVDALAAVQAAHAGLTVTKQAAIPPGLPVRSLDYTITATNMSVATLTQVVLTDAIPAGTTFAGASGHYTYEGGVVTWTVPSLASQATLTATLTVSAAPGTRVVNGHYGVRASEHPTSALGAPVETTVPWRCLLMPVFKQWTAGGERD
jgi:subtilisin family serine protease